MFFLGLAVGIIVGCFIGVITVCILSVVAEADKTEEDAFDDYFEDHTLETDF